MNVQRYELEIYHCNGGEMLVSETGDYVSHDDYAALEAKCAALAAENAGLKAKGREMLSEAAVVYKKHNELINEPWGAMVDCQTLCEFQEVIEAETPATDSFLAEVRASTAPDEATERDLFEEWVMESVCISKPTLEGLRTDGGYRHSTLSGKDYNGMWEQWKAIRAAQLRQGGAA